MGLFANFFGIAAKMCSQAALDEPKVAEAASVLHSCETNDGWITPAMFLDAYNVRVYDSSSDQHDIKIMKQHDFAGGYVIWNRTKRVFHTGVGSCVYKKLERHFTGYGNQSVFTDYNHGDDIVMTLYRLENTEYDDIQSLQKALVEEFGTYPIH